MYNRSQKVSSFCGIDFSEYEKLLHAKIVKEIESKSKEYILNIDENEYVDYLYNENYLEPLNIDINSVIVNKPVVKREILESRFRDYQYECDVYYILITFLFTGTTQLFSVKPNPWTLTSYDIDINDNSVSFTVRMTRLDADEFKREKEVAYDSAFANIGHVNKNVEQYNSQLKSTIFSLLKRCRDKYIQENAFYQAINVKVDQSTEVIYTVPTVKRKVIPQPLLNEKREFISEPTMADNMYNDVLNIIYQVGKSWEKKPSVYQGKDEEDLRDLLLTFLETRYEGTTATGETFNKNGKTDILLKHVDGTNLFIGECKFWHGASEFAKAINQLFDRYLTWRDSKVALICFVKNDDFTNVINVARNEITKHSYFLAESGAKGESSFSYKFHLPKDVKRKVYVELILFHFAK